MNEPEPRVLLIEDEPQMQRFLRALLHGNGYRVVEARTGAEGITFAAQYTPDIVLLDLGLPDMDGLMVTRRLREWSELPIIVISARDKEGDKVAALDAGRPAGVIEKSQQHALQCRVHFPVVRGEAEVAAGAARLFETSHQLFHRRARNEAVTAELGVMAIAQHVRIDHAIALGAIGVGAVAADPPPVAERARLPRAHRRTE